MVKGCPIDLNRGVLMCPPHWQKLPRALKEAIDHTWNNGNPLRGYRANLVTALKLLTQEIKP